MLMSLVLPVLTVIAFVFALSCRVVGPMRTYAAFADLLDQTLCYAVAQRQSCA